MEKIISCIRIKPNKENNIFKRKSDKEIENIDNNDKFKYERIFYQNENNNNIFEYILKDNIKNILQGLNSKIISMYFYIWANI